MRTTTLLLCILILFLLSSWGCKSGPVVIEEGLTQAELFQRAQEAADDLQWDTALSYYNAFLERYPDDTPNVYSAEYEIAFIYYKKGELENAKDLFLKLIEKYEENNDPQVPE